MSTDISLYIAGHLNLDEFFEFLADESERPITSNIQGQIDPIVYAFSVDFKDPFDRRTSRSIRGHMSQRVGWPISEHLGDGDYTSLLMGAHGNAEKIMRAVADKFGGYLYDDRIDSGEMIEPLATAPRM